MIWIFIVYFPRIVTGSWSNLGFCDSQFSKLLSHFFIYIHKVNFSWLSFHSLLLFLWTSWLCFHVHAHVQFFSCRATPGIVRQDTLSRKLSTISGSTNILMYKQTNNLSIRNMFLDSFPKVLSWLVFYYSSGHIYDFLECTNLSYKGWTCSGPGSHSSFSGHGFPLCLSLILFPPWRREWGKSKWGIALWPWAFVFGMCRWPGVFLLKHLIRFLCVFLVFSYFWGFVCLGDF